MKLSIKREIPNALILDEARGKLLEHIDKSKIPTSSIERVYHKNHVHLLKRDREGNLTVPVIDDKIKDGETPKDVYEALRCVEAVPLFCVPENQAKGIATKVIAIVIGCQLVFLFLIWANALGSSVKP
jgi:hypothetical protein